MSGECDKCGEHATECECCGINFRPPDMVRHFLTLNYFQDLARSLCEESGHTCSKWTDWKVFDDLKFLDEKDGGTRADEYWKRCHSIECVMQFKYGSATPEVKVRCHTNNMRSCEFCDYTNEKVEKKLVKELIECKFFE